MIHWRFWAFATCVFLCSSSGSQAQEFLEILDQSTDLSDRTIQLFLLISVLSIAPGLAVMITCFPFFVTVFAILRQGLGLQQSPPNILLVSLALFLTFFVMQPVFETAWVDGIQPLISDEIEYGEAFEKTFSPFRTFMMSRIDFATLDSLHVMRFQTEAPNDPNAVPASVLLPSFMLSEISRAFQVGFIVFLPFLIIDLVVAAVLMSMGMMMVPPVIVSLPFKLSFFVLADGWRLLTESLLRSYQL